MTGDLDEAILGAYKTSLETMSFVSDTWKMLYDMEAQKVAYWKEKAEFLEIMIRGEEA